MTLSLLSFIFIVRSVCLLFYSLNCMSPRRMDEEWDYNPNLTFLGVVSPIENNGAYVWVDWERIHFDLDIPTTAAATTEKRERKMIFFSIAPMLCCRKSNITILDSRSEKTLLILYIKVQNVSGPVFWRHTSEVWKEWLFLCIFNTSDCQNHLWCWGAWICYIQ